MVIQCLLVKNKLDEVTTGTQSPTLKKNIGFALLKAEYAVIGT